MATNLSANTLDVWESVKLDWIELMLSKGHEYGSLSLYGLFIEELDQRVFFNMNDREAWIIINKVIETIKEMR